jgi:hypothetical protein
VRTKRCTSAIRKGRLDTARQFADTARENHDEAVGHLAKIDRELARDLRTLLGMKTSAGYSDVPASGDHRKKAGRAMERLVTAAEGEP